MTNSGQAIIHQIHNVLGLKCANKANQRTSSFPRRCALMLMTIFCGHIDRVINGNNCSSLVESLLQTYNSGYGSVLERSHLCRFISGPR